LNDATRFIQNFPANQEIDLLAEGFDFNKIQLNLSEEEYHRLNQSIFDLVMDAAKNRPSLDRKRRILSYMFIPINDLGIFQ
jgi:hypothetical protein